MNWWEEDSAAPATTASPTRAPSNEWWKDDVPADPAHASLASGFDTSLDLPDVQSLDRSYGGLEGTDLQTERGNSDPILRALPVAPRQKVQLDTEGVDPYRPALDLEGPPLPEQTLNEQIMAQLPGL